MPLDSQMEFLIEHTDNAKNRELRYALDFFKQKKPRNGRSDPDWCPDEFFSILERHVDEITVKANATAWHKVNDQKYNLGGKVMPATGAGKGTVPLEWSPGHQVCGRLRVAGTDGHTRNRCWQRSMMPRKLA